MKKIKLTIFTPTYNRANRLSQLYECLKAQTNKDFIWLIIDDGSTDNTRQFVENWESENKIKIEYLYKENGGKQTAIDLAHQVCTTEYICCCDSDDIMSNDAAEVIYKYIEQYKDDKDLVGFVGRVTNFNGDIIGYKGETITDNWPENSIKVCFYDLSTKYNYNGETVLVFKTEIVKNYHFPVFEGEKFVTESVLYKQFMYNYKMATMLELIHPIEYQQDGYTNQGMALFFKNPKGFLYSEKLNAYYEIKYGHNFKRKIKNCARFYAWKKVLNIKFRELDNFKIKFFYSLLGKIASILFINKFKKIFNEYLKRTR